MMQRVETGVEGLDEKIGGGLPESSVTLISGGPGAGKTTMCSHFLEKGLENDESCLMISTSQKPDEIVEDSREFGIDLDNGDITTAHVSPSKDVADSIRSKVAEQSFDRIALDSLSVFEMFWGRQDQLRKYINKLMEHFREIDSTVMVTSERSKDEGLTRFGIAEFLVDGVIELRGYALGNDPYRSLRVIKMRRTAVGSNPWVLEIGDAGLSVREMERI